MRKLLQILLLAGFIGITAQTQNLNAPDGETSSSLPNIIPPSPTAYSLGNYGNVPVGLFIGAPNISVPLFTYKTNNITLPLSLFYGSNGIKVDEVSSNVGLGWNLNFGGVITRMVRDLPDDRSQMLNIPSNAFQPNNNPAYWNFIYTMGNLSPGIDSQRDLYSFNFNGYSGKFFYDRNNQVHLVDQQPIQIEKGNGFTITLPTGEKYYFTAEEGTTYHTPGVHPTASSSGTTAWYLTKIVHPKGDEIYFTYEDTSMFYTTSKSQNFTLSLPYETCEANTYVGSGTQLGDEIETTTKFDGKRIKTISSNNSINGSIQFIYSTDSNNIDTDGNYKIQNIIQTDINANAVENISFNYLNTPNKRNFLTNIAFKDPNKSYNFEYENPNSFPERLSYSRDYWGYYNGKANNTLVPKIYDYNLENYNYGANQEPDPNFAKIGLLKKITYPTKGYTELEYEGNTYWGEKTDYPPITTQPMSVLNTGIQPVTYTLNFTSQANQRVEITGHSFTTETGTGDPTRFPRTDVEGASFYVWSDYQGYIQEGPNYSFVANGEFPTIYFDAVAGQDYTLIFTANRATRFVGEIKYYATAPHTYNDNLDTGGIRIKSTKDYKIPSAIPKYTRYYYGPKDDINHSSGDKGKKPYFTSQYKSSEVCFPDGFLCKTSTRYYIIESSSSLLSLFDTDKGTSCLYKYVTISNGGDQFEKGGEAKEFTINRDAISAFLWGENNIQNTPYTNYGWNNGSEIISQTLSKNSNGSLDVVQKKENNYVTNNAYTFELKNFAHRRNDLEECATGPTAYYCTQYDITNPDHVCYGKSVGTKIDIPYIKNLDVTEYRNISYWHYLKSQKTTDYMNGLPLLTTTEYFYNNPSHYQLTKQKTTFPDQSYQTTDYSYAHEKGKTLMIQKNMVGIPLETVTKKGSKIISKTYTDYPDTLPDTQTGNLLLPKSVSSLDLVTGNLSTEVTYNLYDSKGNPQQYTSKTGVSTAIIWGYNQTQPIAKIEGATYAQVSSLASAIINASNDDANDAVSGNPKEGDMLIALDAFRNNSTLAGFQITTYTYDPLIGVRSITPPSGVREVYIYDTANRLKEVKDVNGNILKSYEYHYKP